MTAAEIQDMILREVGAGLEGLPDEVLSAVLDKVTPYIQLYWETWAWKAQIYPGLQALYVKRQCLDVILGQVRDLTNVTIGSASITQGQISQNLNLLRTNTQTEIERAEKMSQSSRPPVIGVLSYPEVIADIHGRLSRPRSSPPPPDMIGRGW